MTSLRIRCCLLISACATVGCAGSGVQISADSAHYPISFSQTISDDHGRLFDGRSLVEVGSFRAHETRVGVAYSLWTPRSVVDISHDIDAQVSAVRGEAVVGAAVSVGSGCKVLNAFPILNAIPFWPGCIPITVTGQIVRRRTP